MKKHILLFCVIAAFTSLCNAQSDYQLKNNGFEQWDGGYDSEPTHWNTFESSDGSYSSMASANHHYRRSGHRPGGDGNYYLTLYTKSIIGIKANGNMTTGRIHAGSMSAGNSENYNYTQRSNNNHSQPFTATPDSMYVWVSFYASSNSSTAQISAIIHGNSDFKAPNEENTTSLYKAKAVAQTTRTTSSASQMSWQQLKVPFVYNGTSEAAYILVNITTNNIPGGGDKNDSISVDDIEFIYSAWLSDLRVNGSTVADFSKGQFFYGILVDDLSTITSDCVEPIAESDDATIEKTIVFRGDSIATVTILVTAEDGNTKSYKVQFATSENNLVGIDNVPAQTRSDLSIFPNPASDRVNVNCHGSLEFIDMKGQTWMRTLCDGEETIDISQLPRGIYILHIDGKKTERKIIIQ